MASQRNRQRETCAFEDCGSRRFHVGEDGFTYCDQGHQQSERGTVIAEDTGELMLLGKKSRKKDSDVESATSRGIELYPLLHTRLLIVDQPPASAVLMHSSTTCSAFN